MALTPYQSDALIKEVDDAVRQDDMLSFWSRYGRVVAGAVVLALGAYGGWLLWQNHRNSVAEANSEQFADLLKSAEAASLDQPVYDKLVAGGGPGYKSQAQLVKAALAAGKNDDKEAVATYDAIIADPAALQPAKDAALIRKTALSFDSMAPDQVVAALKGLAVPGNAWYGSAGELTAIAYLKMGKRDLAAELFGSLARDAAVPDSIKLRAGQMASALGAAAPAAPAPALAR
ncbi:tetratricopeptide repeat protein [Sphingobium nicotianae]|uniref:Tetratricopeptide repeat protein n=1 Tax=Sphingobium nicotianae TaxID=2782607 RepID=A0A9X1DBR5_9SPHN|nr:tetratricopeptide repeat protein [Sphingobium nicotianae]MBT2187057.1 tetratricopeptide repeat protein [Sphingobium nicotianae]